MRFPAAGRGRTLDLMAPKTLAVPYGSAAAPNKPLANPNVDEGTSSDDDDDEDDSEKASSSSSDDDDSSSDDDGAVQKKQRNLFVVECVAIITVEEAVNW